MTPAAVLPWLLGLAWGVVLAWPIARRAAHVGVAERAAVLSLTSSPRRPRRVSTTWFGSWRGRHANGVVPRVVRSLWSIS